MGLPARPGAAVDPSDQHDAASARAMGCHGVLAAELSQASAVGLAEAVALVAGADGGGRFDRGTARALDHERSLAAVLWWDYDTSLRAARRQLFHVRANQRGQCFRCRPSG